MATSSDQFAKHVIIVGVGLIGGSIAAAVRKRFPATRVTGIGRDESRLAAAVDAGLINDFATQITPEQLADQTVAVICLPVQLIAAYVKSIAAIAPSTTLITDAGSVKTVICDEISGTSAAENFVGAHPIAGGEQAGFEHADPELFVDSVCVLTADPNSPEPVLMKQAWHFWEGIGCRIQLMSPAEHDRALARTSHLPHVMAAITASAVGEDNLPLAGSGFRDTTRIAAGNASLWKEILIGNSTQIISALDHAETILKAYRTALQETDAEQIEQLLKNAADFRSKL